MKRYLKPFLLGGMLLLAVMLISWFAFPTWAKTPGGIWSLLGMAGLAVLAIMRDLIGIYKDLKPAKKQNDISQTQKMVRSADGEQTQKKSGGPQSQVMEDSPRGSQRQE